MEIKPVKPASKTSAVEPGAAKASATPELKAPQGQWNFINGRIEVNGQDVADIISQTKGRHSSFLSDLARDLEAFRNHYIRRNIRRRRKRIGKKEILEEIDPTGQLGHLSALVDAYIAKIMRQLKRQYDQTADGLFCEVDEDGQLILNGMNVNAFIQTARNHPNDKARLFLKGIRGRLAYVLENKRRTASFERLKEVVQKLFDEIDLEIQRIIDKDRLLGK